MRGGFVMMTEKGPVIGEPGSTSSITIVNPSDRDWTRNAFVLAFGAYGWTRLLCYAQGIEDALDVAGEWIAEHAPGLLCNEQVQEEYDRAIAEGLSEEDAQERAEEDCTPIGDGSVGWVLSWEWSIVCENPSRAELFALAGVEPKAKKGGEKRRQAA
jgi:hypothetical protein